MIPGSVDLHELPRIRHNAADGKAVDEGKSKGTDPFHPMLPVLSNDIFDIVFIDQVISLHDRNRGLSIFDTAKDSLLILKGYLGIRNQ